MREIIKQVNTSNIVATVVSNDDFYLNQDGDDVIQIDKQGAAQLIKVLQEWIEK